MTTALENRTTHVGGELLVPKFDELPGVTGGDEHAYWMGVTPDCPIAQINIAGLNFPKRNEIFMVDPINPGGQKIRVPAIGGLHKKVTQDHILALREVLPRLVIRFAAAQPEQKEEPGTGQNTGHVFKRGVKAELVIIPTPAQIVKAKKEVEKTGKNIRIPRYSRDVGDRPAADFMFFKLCLNQEDPRRELTVPETIRVGGIFWPGDIDEINALLS